MVTNYLFQNMAKNNIFNRKDKLYEDISKYIFHELIEILPVAHIIYIFIY
jgi:hypothetical protein